MRIAVYHNLPPGGAKRVLYEQLKYLSDKHEIYLYVLSKPLQELFNPSKIVEKLREYDFRVADRKGSVIDRVARDYRSLLAVNSVHKVIAKDILSDGCEVAMIHTDRFTEAPYLLRYLDIPSLYYDQEMLATAYSPDFKFKEEVVFYKKLYEYIVRYAKQYIDKKSAIKATAIVTNSKFMKNHIREVYAKESLVCYPGVDTKIFKKTAKRKPLILYLGSKSVTENYFPLKRLVSLTKKTMDIRIVGGSNTLEIKSDKKMARVFSSATVTLGLNPIEAFGLKTVESMACETPVLAVNEGGYEETVVDGVTGYLLPRDPEAFAQKIKYLYKNPDIVKRMGKSGREHVKKNFTWEVHNKCLEKHLLRLAKNGKKSE
jgi:glycosyltransferase involved in cell wall biosynthesis